MLTAIILAAGKATRMKSDRVKVLHPICGRPMLSYVLDACRAVGVRRLFLVVGHDKESVMQTYKNDADITWVTQEEQKGTGHACLVCHDAFTAAGAIPPSPSPDAHTFILCGDGPLIRPHTLEQLLAEHKKQNATITLATANLPDPAGYGRIVRDPPSPPSPQGNVVGIVEHNDATPAQRAVHEVNPSYYLFRTADLFTLLGQVKPNNKKGEYYLTDTLTLALASGGKLAALCAVPPEDVLSINTRADLAAVNKVMQTRIQKEVMDSGVTLISPENTWIEFPARIGQDTIIEPFTWIGSGAQIPPGSHIKAGTIVPPNAKY